MHASNIGNLALADPPILLPGESAEAQGTAALSLMTDTDQVRQTKGSVSAELRDSERRFSQMIDALPAAEFANELRRAA